MASLVFGVFVLILIDLFLEKSRRSGVHEYYENWWQRFNVHSSPKHRLVFQGMTFDDVIGKGSFYVRMPSIGAVLFVQGVGGGSGQRIVVLYDDGQKIYFEDPYGSFLERPGDSNLIVVSSSNKMIELRYRSELVDVTYWFDIATRQFSKKYLR